MILPTVPRPAACAGSSSKGASPKEKALPKTTCGQLNPERPDRQRAALRTPRPRSSVDGVPTTTGAGHVPKDGRRPTTPTTPRAEITDHVMMDRANGATDRIMATSTGDHSAIADNPIHGPTVTGQCSTRLHGVAQLHGAPKEPRQPFRLGVFNARSVRNKTDHIVDYLL